MPTEIQIAKGIMYYRIPVNLEKWRLWLVAIGREDLILLQVYLFAAFISSETSACRNTNIAMDNS